MIKKVLNSSVILAVDENGRESVLLGKGIGYGQKAGTPVPDQAADQTFIDIANPDGKNLVELLTSIPGDFVDITRDIVVHAETEYGMKLHPHIYLALTDHLHFAMQRAREGLAVVNRLAWEIQTFYPREHAVGLYGLGLLRNRLKVELPDEEASNIAFHVANAQSSTDSSFDALRAVKLISAVMTIVSYTMNIQLINDNLHMSRFVSHMQYFASRFFDKRMLTSRDDFLFTQVSGKYTAAWECAEKVRTHILAEHGELLPNEEVAYLTLHIQRLADS